MGIFTFGLVAIVAIAFALWMKTKGGKKWLNSL